MRMAARALVGSLLHAQVKEGLLPFTDLRNSSHYTRRTRL